MASLTDIAWINGLPFDLASSDVITGSQTADQITVFGGNDYVFALGDNDLITDVSSLAGGNSGNDTIFGGDGDDRVISSLDSANSYYGGSGIDTLDVSQVKASTVVDLRGMARADNASNYQTAISSFENVLGSDFRDVIFGNEADNVLDCLGGDDSADGRDGNDTIYGGDGADVLNGSEGNDLLLGVRGNDLLLGGKGDDRLYGGPNNDNLIAGDGNDRVDGGEGVDQVLGGLGRDILVGGTGADAFVFLSASESRSGNADLILDFRRTFDTIDIGLVDGNSRTAGDQVFKFIGDKAFTAAGQISSHYDTASKTTIVSFNTDTDTAAEMAIKLAGKIALSAADFIL